MCCFPSSCNKSKLLVKENEWDQTCEARLKTYMKKFNFNGPIDSLKAIQPCTKELANDSSEAIITRNLFKHIQVYYLSNLADNQFEIFYKYPKNSVALYNYLLDTNEVEVINNGIRIIEK